VKRLLLPLALISCASGGGAPKIETAEAVEAVDAKAPAIAPRPPLPARAVATCPLEAAFAIRSGEKLRLGEGGDVEARFTGHAVLVRIDRIDTATSVASVVVRAPAKSPALRLDGRLDAGVIPLRAARDIRVAGENVVIPRGTSIVVTSGDGAALGVQPRYGDFGNVATVASCEDLAFEVATERGAKKVGEYMHLTKSNVVLFAAPGGPAIIELVTRHDSPSVDVVESRGPFRHIRYDDGVRIDAWMRAVDLAPGEGPDCDDCHGWPLDVDDTCPPNECVDAKGGPFHASHKVAVRDRPSPEGQPLGWLEEDAEVRIVGHRGTYARVEPVKNEIAGPAGGLWIDEGILRPRGK
jgi:hypothetical protein